MLTPARLLHPRPPTPQDQAAADARAQHLVTNWQRRDAELPDAIPPGRGREEDYVVGPLWDRGALRAIANGSMPVTEVPTQPDGSLRSSFWLHTLLRKLAMQCAAVGRRIESRASCPWFWL